MPDRVFRAVVGSLADLRFAGRVEFYIYNEPTKHFEWLLQCIASVRRNVPRSTLMIASNGDYLNPEKIAQLYDAGLNQLLVNCYSPGLFERRSHWPLPADVELDGEIYAPLPAGRRTFKMLDKSNPATFGSGVFKLQNRSGAVPDVLPPTQEPLRRMCVKPFRFMNVNWQGDVLVCCNDYHGDVVMGNVVDAPLDVLWNHPVMNTYRAALHAKDRSLPLCSTCDAPAGAYPGNVDTAWGDTIPAHEITLRPRV